jgi:endonuclease I
MKIKTLIVAGLFIYGLKGMGQIPDNYYAPAENLSSYELKTALYQIIKDHTVRSYKSLWTYFEDTDQKADGTVWDMYSDIPGGTPPYTFTFSSDQCGSSGYSDEGDCYNREHSFPKSWFGGASPMYSDLFHLYPTDGYVNNIRGNFPFGEVSSPTETSLNGSKRGPCSYPGYTDVVFEPIDAYKGDFARSYFYMATRYENIIASWQNYDSNGDAVLDGSSDQVFEQWFLNLLIDWHHQDPVSTKETGRNNKIYNTIQGNRNPFIDHPEYVDCIWLNECDPTPDTTVNTDTCIQCMRFPGTSDNPVWTEEWIYNDLSDNQDTTYLFYTLSGDTVFNDTTYSKLMKSIDQWPASENLEYVGGLRSDTCGHVWFVQDNLKYLLFDFSGLPNDTIFYQPAGRNTGPYLIVQTVDSAILNDMVYHKVLTSKNTEDVWIEGIGNINGFLSNALPMTDCKSTSISAKGTNCGTWAARLNCFYLDNQLIFKNCLGDCYKEDPTSVATVMDDKSVNKELFSAYPQPAGNTLYIKFKTTGQYSFCLLNSTGLLVKESSPVEDLEIVDISGFAQGLYVIRATNIVTQDSFHEKVVVVH